MTPAWAFWEIAIAAVGVGFGLGGLARRRQHPSRGPGDRLTAWGLIVSGLVLVAHGAATLAGMT